MKLLAWFLIGFTGLAAFGRDLPPLNSPATTEAHPGKLIWAELFTADPAAATPFYTALLGWSAVTIDRTTATGIHPYTVFSLGDRPVAGVAKRPLSQLDAAHGRWVGFASVPDVKKALDQASARGGQVLSAAKTKPDRGVQGVLSDPEGAVFGVMHSSSGDPGEFFPEFGDWAWAELVARNPQAESLYYSAVAGYERIPDTRTERTGNFVLASGGFSRASVVIKPLGHDSHPLWLLFVRVASVKDAEAEAVRLGGRVLVPAADSPTKEWRAVLADPGGAIFGVVQLDEAAAAKGQP